MAHNHALTLVRALPPALLVALAGCSSLPPAPESEALRRSVIESIRGQIDEDSARARAEAPRVSEPDSLGLTEERLDELAEFSGPASYADADAPLGPDLDGGEPEESGLTLSRALELAITGADNARAARLNPPITSAQLVQAEAAFDWVLFANLDRSVTDRQQPAPFVGMTPVGTGLSRSDAVTAGGGVRKRLTTNGTLELSTTFNVDNNSTPGFSTSPDPARTASLDLIFNQPLLRGFGADVALADVRLADNANEDALESTRDTLMGTIVDVESAYWTLRRARESLLIRQRLLERGIETREALRGRYGFDVTDAELADASARVETRRADVIRAQRAVRNASDTLKRLINDPDRPMISETALVASEAPLTVPTVYHLGEAISGALQRRPDVRRALIRVQDAAVREGVARDAVLPQLDLSLRLSAYGLDDNAGDAYEESFERDFVDAAIGLSFELPLGNRDALSGRRAARLRGAQSVIEYRAAARLAVEDVKAALRDVSTNFRLIEQTRLARLAAAENLRALLVEEETVRGLTPDFLNLKLNRQEALALAELEEIGARTDYAIALARASRALGLSLEQAGVTVAPEDLETNADRVLDEPALRAATVRR